MRRILFYFLIFSSVVSATSEVVNFSDNLGKNHLFNIISTSDAGVEIIFSMLRMVVEEIEVDGMPMKTYGVPGIFLPNDEGAPSLQGTGRYIAIPQGATAKATIIETRKEVYHNIEVAPAPKIPLETDTSPLRYVKNMEIYGKNEYYPDSPVKLSEPMQIRGVDCVILGITPFQYNPITKELIVYKDIRVRIDFIGGNGRFGEPLLRNPYWEPILQGHLLNYNSLPAFDYDEYFARCRTQDKSGRNGAEYIIIVPDDPAFIAWAETIKVWRKLQGISTVVYNLTQIGGNTTTAIKNFLTNAYNTWNPRPVGFLLLSDYENSGKTYGITSYRLTHPYQGTYIMDNWYADITGDNLPDMYHGRICAQNESQLSIMIRKFLSYERAPYSNASFYNPIICAAWQTERWFQLCGEVIRGFMINGLSKNPVRLYAIYSGTPTAGGVWSTATNTSTVVNYFYNLGWLPSTTNPNGSSWWNNGNNTLITQAINNGAFLLQHRDHGGETGWGEPAYTNSDISNLTNDKLIFVNSHNCLTGRYDYASEVFTEKFHRYTYNNTLSGALGVNAASQVSYSFVNDCYVWGMYDCMWQQFMPDYPASDITPTATLYPCAAMSYGKYFLQSSSWPYNTSDKVITYNLFHHHGDVFNPLYSQVPQNLTVSHASTLPANATSFSVTANEGSIIALTVNNEIIGVALGTGNPVSIPISPQAPGNTMKVTVTKVNYYRYMASVPIVAGSSAYIIATKTVLNDSNNNAQINPGELINYGVYAKNTGGMTGQGIYGKLSETSPYITMVRDSSWFGNIASNDSAISNPYFQFRPTNNCPNGHIVNLTLKFYDINSNNWTSNLSVTVYAPDLIYQSVAVTGGNGNDILNIGETANLIVMIKNIGGASATNVSSKLKTNSTYITINDSMGNFGTIQPNNSATNSADPYTVTVSPYAPAGTSVQFSLIVISGVYIDTLNFSLLIEPYLEDFEINNGNYSANPSSSAWEWGIPTSGPNSSHSGSKLWATVLNGNYANNADWKLTSKEFIATQNNPILKFWHWYNIELSSYYPGRAWDGGNVKISTDSGNTWILIRPIGGYDGVAYTTTYGIAGESCYSGIDTVWTEEQFTLPVNIGQRFFLRWHFGSDGGVVRPGWYVDDISSIGFVPFVKINDVGVEAIIYPNTSHQVSTPLQPKVRLRNYGNISQSNFQVICSIVNANGTYRYSNTQTITSINPYDTVRVNFPSWTPTIIEGCTIKIRTKLTNDQNLSNDRMTYYFSIGDYIPPAIPTQILPPNGSSSNNPSPRFFWRLISEAVLYNLVVLKNQQEVINVNISETTYSASQLSSGTYQWKVRARDEAGNWSNFSSEWTLIIIAETPGWSQKEPVNSNLSPAIFNAIKDGGALVGTGDEYLYAFIGTKTNIFRRYSIHTKSGWETVESIPFGFKFRPETGVDPTTINKKFIGKGSALCYDGISKIYAVRGNGTWEFWCYDIPSHTWTQLPYLPSPKAPKSGTSLAYHNNFVYLLVGGHRPTDQTNFYAYNIAESTWTIKAGVHLGSNYKPWKAGSCITELNSKIYALKGGDNYNLFFVYNPTTNSWSDLESMPLPNMVFGQYKTKVLVKDGAAIASDDNAIYAIKGGGTDVFWKYTPGNPGIWEIKDRLPVFDKKHAPKTGSAMAYAGGKIWLLVGNKQPDFWCYTIGAQDIFTTKPSTYPNIATERSISNLKFHLEISPNPFNKLTTIQYTVPIAGEVSIKLYNINGQLIKTIIDEHHNKGNYTTILSTDNLTKGIYFIRYIDKRYQKEIKLIVQ
ncbi:MAG: C25 family cysteine peptidase [candidate division WOR-3 bacterium]|nr:C25 family cysteine peptidase [candidate division WOR-3 bacterium]